MIIEIGSDGKMMVKTDKPLTDVEQDIVSNVSKELKHDGRRR